MIHNLIDRNLKLADLKSPIVLVVGAPAVGKSTILSNTLKPDIYFDLEDFDTFRKLSFQMDFLELVIQDSFKKIAIDNIHLLPGLLDSLNIIIQKNSVQFYISSPSLGVLGKFIPDNLTPLIEVLSVNTLSYKEVADHLSYEQILKTGSLPATIRSKNPLSYLSEVVGQTLFKTIYKNGKTKKPENLSRVLNELAHNLSFEINYELIGKNSSVPGRTVREYVNLLVDFEIGYIIDSLKLTSQSSQQKKFYFYDLGFTNALRNNFDLASDRTAYLSLLEQFVLIELQLYKKINYPGLEINFWKDYQNNSIHFVLNKKVALFLIPTEQVHDYHLKHVLFLLNKASLFSGVIITHSKTMSRKNDAKNNFNVNVVEYDLEKFLESLWKNQLFK